MKNEKGLGAIRAAYQFKGNATVDGNVLKISVDEIYSTKPGPEAGIRLDVLGDVEHALKSAP